MTTLEFPEALIRVKHGVQVEIKVNPQYGLQSEPNIPCEACVLCVCVSVILIRNAI